MHMVDINVIRNMANVMAALQFHNKKGPLQHPDTTQPLYSGRRWSKGAIVDVCQTPGKHEQLHPPAGSLSFWISSVVNKAHLNLTSM